MGGAVPLQIEGYEEFVEIGRGGFAVVYRARQTRLRRLVAVKVLTGTDTSPAALSRFEAECAAIGALSGHTNVVAVHDAGTTADGRPYLAMEYLPDGSLAQRLERGPVPTDEVLAIGAQLAGALSAAHAANVLHRDVKPENVLLGPQGTPKLADFGIAVVADVHQTATGVVIGTVLHSAPEVLRGQRATMSTDVYSLASTLFTLVNGRPAFAGDHDEGVAPVMYRTVHHDVPDLRPKGVPGPVADLLEQGMAKQPEARFGSSAAFLRAIEGTIGSVSAAGPAPTPAPRAPLTPVILPAPRAPLTPVILPAPDRAGTTRPRPTPTPPPPWQPAPAPRPSPAAFAPPPPAPTPHPTPSPYPVAATPAPTGGPPVDATPATEPERSQRGLVIALVVAVFVLVVAIIAALVVVLGDDDPGAVQAGGATSSTTSSSSSTSTSTSTTSTSTSTTAAAPAPPPATAPPATAPPPTTAAPTTTTTEPRAATPEEAVAAVRARFPDYTVTDRSGFRSEGAGVMLGEDATGRTQAFLFGDGRLTGRDSTEPSIRMAVVSVGGDQVVLHYDLWRAGEQPPQPPQGESQITLTWDGGDRFVPSPPDFPSTDVAVDGHR